MAGYEELAQDEQVKALLETLAEKYPGKRLRPIDTAAGVVVCVNPSRPQHTAFLAQLFDDDKTVNAKAFEGLLRATAVHPEPGILSQWLNEFPGIAADKDVVGELKILSGSAKDSHAKR